MNRTRQVKGKLGHVVEIYVFFTIYQTFPETSVEK